MLFSARAPDAVVGDAAARHNESEEAARRALDVEVVHAMGGWCGMGGGRQDMPRPTFSAAARQ